MLCIEGENCWRCLETGKVSFLIDGADYFEAFVQAVLQAEQAVYIAGWDIDSQLELDRRNRFSAEIPHLGPFLNRTVQNNPNLNIHILAWDFPMMYLQERQWLPTLHLGWHTHRRVHFRLDSEHPLGASQHQKIVVVDDQIAFCGGIDLTKNRWDTPDHSVGDSRRKDSDGRAYTPFHDVQMAVNGEAARSFGDLFRERWHRATGEVLSIPRTASKEMWPADLPADIKTPVQVGIARTLPPYKRQEAVREVERLYLDCIKSAEEYIYIENQYLTADRVCDALGKRLAEDDPPEVLMVMPKEASGWLEQSTMDAIRCHQLENLHRKDRKKRLGIYYPVADDGRTPVYIHSKLMIVDDCIAVVGSANLSNRSMGLDSECCMVVEGKPGTRAGSAVKEFLRTLLAEHLRVSHEQMADMASLPKGLVGMTRRLSNSDAAGLKSLDRAGPLVDGTEWILDHTYLDPEAPFMVDQMIDHFSRGAPSNGAGVPQYVKGGILLLALLGLAAIWRWTPLADWITKEQLVQWAGLINDIPLLVMTIVAAFVVGGLLFVPITLMIGATALILPGWQSFFCALAGTLLNALATNMLGRYLGRNTVRKLAGHRLDGLNKMLARKGVIAIALVRNIPVAPFSLVNIVAGTTGIRMHHYLMGTAIGMFPGILAITFFTDRFLALIEDPTWVNAGAALAVAGIFGLGFWWVKKRFRQEDAS